MALLNKNKGMHLGSMDAPQFIAGWRGWGVIPFISSHPTTHSRRVLLRPCATTHLKTRPARTPATLAIVAPVSQESLITIIPPHRSPPQFTSTHQTPARHTPRKPSPAAASEPTNRRTKPWSHKHPQERSITNSSWQQHPGEIAAGGLWC